MLVALQSDAESERMEIRRVIFQNLDFLQNVYGYYRLAPTHRVVRCLAVPCLVMHCAAMWCDALRGLAWLCAAAHALSTVVTNKRASFPKKTPLIVMAATSKSACIYLHQDLFSVSLRSQHTIIHA